MTTTSTDLPSRDQLVERALQFFRRGLIARGVPSASARAATAKGTDRWLTVEAWAQGLEVVLANNRALEDATMADTATGDDLDRLAELYGLTRSAGAGAQGDVLVVCAGTVVYAAGQEATSDRTGKRYKVVSVTSATNGDAVPMVGIDTGDSTNLDAGETLTWVSPPSGSASTCEVASGGLTDGKDADSDERLRTRLLKLLREPQNGGSWAHYRQWAEDASAAVEAAYVYPAAQGPGTVHVAYSVEGTADNRYSRIGSAALTLLVANAIVGEQPEFADATITTVAHHDIGLALSVTLPEPPDGGGAGGGWIDPAATRWPTKSIGAGATSGVPRISVVTSSTSFTTDANVAPTVGVSVLIFSSTDRKPYLAVIESVGGSAGARTFTLDRALPTVVVGDYLAPACEQGEAYAETLMGAIALLAPGEKTTVAGVLPRAYRHPKASEGFPSALTTTQLVKLQTEHTEITVAAYFAKDTTGSISTVVSLPLEPDAPTLVTDPPKVFRVQNLAFYPT